MTIRLTLNVCMWTIAPSLVVPNMAHAQRYDWPNIANKYPLVSSLFGYLVGDGHHRLAFDRTQYQSLADILLLSGIPVEPRQPVSFESHYSEMQPAGALITSALFRQGREIRPTESVAVFAILAGADSLFFRCELIGPDATDYYPCEGTFDLRNAEITFSLNELLLWRTAEIRDDNRECEVQVKRAEEQRCLEQEQVWEERLVCGFRADLRARAQCRELG